MKTLKNLAIVLTLFIAPVLGQGNSVTGTWKVNGDVSGHAIDQICDFTQDGKKLVGTCKSADADKPLEITGEVTDQKVAWQFNTDYQGQNLTVAFAGTLDASSAQLKGDIDVKEMGVGGTFSAAKQEAKKEEAKKPQ